MNLNGCATSTMLRCFPDIRGYIVIANRKIICFLAVLILISLNSGCTLKNTRMLPVNKPNNIEWPDSQLKDRFEEYWGYRSSGDVTNVLKLEAPYVKVMVDPEKYAGFISAGKNKVWNAVRIENIEWKNQNLIFIGFTAEVKDEAASIRTREVYFKDRWVLMNEKWYHAFDDPFINPDK
ncbi:MAG: hypothetical protein HY881_11735 [Deltaproteobacteria bacterium]|nr:hypothetical protein [Deltaproteobacteria bacterium]